jgi:hypothetical protein
MAAKQTAADYLHQLQLAEMTPDATPVEDLPDGYSVAEEAGENFTRALRLAGRLAKGIEQLDTYEAALTETLGEEALEAQTNAATLVRRFKGECYRLAKSRTERMKVLFWSFCRPFASKLPPGKQTIMLPGGLQFHWANNPDRQEWAEDPTDYEKHQLLAWEFARRLPMGQQEQAIRLVPELNKTWLKQHLVTPDGGGTPVYRYTDPETDDVTEMPATVERTIAEEPRQLPIMVTLPPEEPLRYEVVYPDKRKSASIKADPRMEALLAGESEQGETTEESERDE